MAPSCTSAMMTKPRRWHKRIKVYLEQTAPLVDYYRAAGKLVEIDGTQPIDEGDRRCSVVRDRRSKIMNLGRQIHLKSPAELKIMREAGRINAEVLATVQIFVQPGVSTADLNAAAEEVLKKHGCYSPFKDYGHPPFPASICTSINEELVHGIPSKKRKLREGDIVSMDCGTVFEGFVADFGFHGRGGGDLSGGEAPAGGHRRRFDGGHRKDARRQSHR